MRTRLLLAAARRLLAAATVLAPSVAAAQVTDSVGTAIDTTIAAGGRLYEVAALAGYQWFDRSAALRGAPTIGFRIVHPELLARLPGFYVGMNTSVSRPTSRGDYFPWNRQIYFSGDATRRNDTTLVYEVSQQVTLGWVGLDAGYRFGGRPGGATMRSPTDWRAIEFDASVGAGFYGLWVDPEQNRRNELHSRRGWLLGGGIAIPLAGNTRIVVRAEDLVFIRFNREWLSLHDPLFAEELWPNPVTTPPPAKGTVHNARLTLQFTFVPGATVAP